MLFISFSFFLFLFWILGYFRKGAGISIVSAYWSPLVVLGKPYVLGIEQGQARARLSAFLILNVGHKITNDVIVPTKK